MKGIIRSVSNSSTFEAIFVQVENRIGTGLEMLNSVRAGQKPVMCIGNALAISHIRQTLLISLNAFVSKK